MASTRFKYTRRLKPRVQLVLIGGLFLATVVLAALSQMVAVPSPAHQESVSGAQTGGAHAANNNPATPNSQAAPVYEGMPATGSERHEQQDDSYNADALEQSTLVSLERSYEQATDLVSTARLLLEEYQAQVGTRLVRSGYVDLLGRVWSCTVVRGSEVDICFVQERDAQASTVRVLRVRRDAIEELVCSQIDDAS